MFGMLDQERQPEMSKYRAIIKRLANQEVLTKEERQILLCPPPDEIEDTDEDKILKDVQEEELSEFEAQEIQLRL
jgi:hypothetical protein